jgi:hypothetical protein
MQRTRFFSAPLVVLIAALACNFPGAGASPTPGFPPSELTPSGGTAIPPAASPTPTLTVPAVPPLTADMLRNGAYKLPQFGETVTLVNGAYDRATSNEDILHVALRDPIAFGDLNGDGAEDAAIFLSENGGGTGFMVSVIVMLNQGGVPVQSADRLVDDRPQVNNLSIQNGRIVVEAVIHGAADPMCCPNFPVTETLRLETGKLILTRFTSTSPGGPLRAINLTAPAPGAAISGSMTVTGSVTVSPFENTLAYAIFDLVGNKLSNGSLLVTSDGMGGPGTFNVPIDISAIAAGTAIRFEVSDLSAADGSVLAMDSVECQVS